MSEQQLRSEQLAAAGFVRLDDLGHVRELYCECASPDVWVRAESQGNRYRCGICGRTVCGMEGKSP